MLLNTDLNKEINELKNKLTQEQKLNNNLTKEINELKNKLSQEKNKNNNYNEIINNLKSQLNNNNIQNNTQNEYKLINELFKQINGLNKIIYELNKKLQRYNINLEENEKLMSVIFSSIDQKVHYSIVCKNTDTIHQLEEELYKEYSEYSTTENYFLCKGKLINKFVSLDMNQIKNGDTIILYKKE